MERNAWDPVMESIKEEMQDAAMYRMLSESAPNKEEEKIVLSLAADHQTLAEDFTNLYHTLTGTWYPGAATQEYLFETYAQAIHHAVMDEADKGKRYGRAASDHTKGAAYQNTYLAAAMTVLAAATQLLYLADQQSEKMQPMEEHIVYDHD